MVFCFQEILDDRGCILVDRESGHRGIAACRVLFRGAQQVDMAWL